MPTVSSVQNIITAYNQQLKFKERLTSVNKIETQQTQKDSVTISKDAKRLFEESMALKHRPVESEGPSDADGETETRSAK
jgi:hypothetical protein